MAKARAPRSVHDGVDPGRRWNAGTWLILGAGILLVMIAASGVAAAAAVSRASGSGEAATVAETFVTSATSGDDAWKDVSSNRLLNESMERSPLRLDEKTMDALGMEVSVTPGEVHFIRNAEPGVWVDEAEADTAYTVAGLTYTWSVLEDDFTYALPQQVWFTRPFYYGDAVADRADPDRTPSAIGPWQATVLSSPQFSVADSSLGRAPARTNLKTTEREGDQACTSVGRLFTQLSESARLYGDLRTTCSLKTDGFVFVGDDVDLGALAAEFPIYDESHAPDPSFVLRTPIEGSPLLAQYPISTSQGDYIITLGAATVGGSAISFDDYQLRVLSIQLEQEQ